MGFFGGYKLVDFKNKNLTSTPIVVKGIYKRCQSLFVKKFVACNLVINGEEFSETDMAIHKEGNEMFVEVGPYQLVIDTSDNVYALVNKGIQTINGKSGENVTLDATDIKLTTTQTTVQDNFIRIDESLEDVIDKLEPEGLTQLIEGSDYISVDVNEDGDKVVVELDETKLDTVVTGGSDNLITSGAVYNKVDSVEQGVEIIRNHVNRLSAGGHTLTMNMIATGKHTKIVFADGTVSPEITTPGVQTWANVIGVSTNGGMFNFTKGSVLNGSFTILGTPGTLTTVSYILLGDVECELQS